MIKAVRTRGAKSLFLKLLESFAAPVHRDAVLAAIATTIAWGPLMRKRISRITARTLPWYLRLYGVMIGASIPGAQHQRGSLCGIPRDERFETWTMADLAFLAMTGKKPTEAEARPLQVLIGLLISNGPGAISAQGAKGAVSADGPQTPGRVQLNKAMVGFLTHTGYSHGGNGFEGMAFLLEQFKDKSLEDPTDPKHGLDLKAMATDFAKAYAREKTEGKELGTDGPRALPGVHHPVFKGKPVNHDPRERFIAKVMEERGDYNVFHDFYRAAGAGALRRRRVALRVLRQCRCRDRGAAAGAAVEGLQERRARGTRSRDGSIHGVPLRPDDRLRCRDRRSPQPRSQHGYAHTSFRVSVRRISAELSFALGLWPSLSPKLACWTTSGWPAATRGLLTAGSHCSA